ncbi:Ground-like domain-containing protein [Aphelenchoides bicaudatus]|nr:Ground-like domain-containing protein [Aphelenchoides bicaudatus]
MKYLLVLAFVAPVSALFFGGGGGCGSSCNSCCAPQPQCSPCAPPPPPCPPAPSCGGCSGGGGGYAVPSCRPRYIIVRPVEQSVGYSSGGGYATSGGYSAPIAGPSYSSGPVAGPSYSAAPAPSYSAPVAAPQQSYSQGPAPQSYSAPVAAPQSYSAPVAAPQQSYSQGPAPVAAPQSSYASTGGTSYKSAARASKTLVADGNCNSKELKIIMETSMVAGDANESKRRVHTTANEQFHSSDNKTIDVVCAPSKISYRVSTDLFCEYTKEDITCFAYQQI